MNGKILFSEQQKFRQIWLWIMLLTVLSILITVFSWGLIRQIVHGRPFGNNPMSDSGLIITFIFIITLAVGLIVLFLSLRLNTVITTEGVGVKFFPMQRSFRNYPWAEITNAEVKKYSPMKYGGHGMRGGGGIGFRISAVGVHLNTLSGKTIVYSVSGNQALFLTLRNGKMVLIGTKNVYEMERALKKIEQINKETQLNKQ
jgi:hypothetical protein